MVGVSSRTSCRQLFQALNILTLVSLNIMEVIRYIRKHHQFGDLNSNIHAHNTRRKMDIHIQSYNTELYKRSVINMVTILYNKLPGYIAKNFCVLHNEVEHNYIFSSITLGLKHTCFSPICGPSSGCFLTFGAAIQDVWGVLV